MILTCGGRRADRYGRLVGAACGATWSSPAGVDPHQAARAAMWRVGQGTAMCPTCARGAGEDDDSPPAAGGDLSGQLELFA